MLGNGHEKNNPKEGDYILFCYGWNDIQRNIYKHTKGIEEHEIHDLINKYIEYISLLTSKYKINPIISCIYPNHRPNAVGVNPLGTFTERLNYTKIANKYLKKKTNDNKLLYWDIYDFITDSEGFIKKEYTKDSIHLDYDNNYLRETIDSKLVNLTNNQTDNKTDNKTDNNDFGFIIPTCIKSKIHLNQLVRCINSIRKHHKDNYIILICNSESYDLPNLFKEQKNIVTIQTVNPGSEDQQIFKVLSETKLFNKAVFIQDSMLLNKALENIDDIDLKFIWHFTNHRIHWDVIEEPKTEYNLKNNIITHTDLIRHNILRDYCDNKEFQEFAIDKLKNKHEWCGSIGSCCIIDKQTLDMLNNKVKFIGKFIKYNSNRDRRVNESLFPLICHYVFPNKNFEDSYDDFYYDGVKHGGQENMINKPTGFDNLKWCSVHHYFSKISFNR